MLLTKTEPRPTSARQDDVETLAKRLDYLIEGTEAAELDLAAGGTGRDLFDRRESGSYYTPADVAEHFWSLFFRHHELRDAGALRQFIERYDFVEPSAGSGIFVFSFLKAALALGLPPDEIAKVRFHVIDINFTALSFFRTKLAEAEEIFGARFTNVGPIQSNFLDWVAEPRFTSVAFVGNPPFVGNPRGSRWRNLYANFLEAMLRHPCESKAIALILPLSVCFSRDYSHLRTLIGEAGLGVSASSYDNIPDALFKSGKPESKNTNRANSQRCTILNLGGPDPARREAACLNRWTAKDRPALLRSIPTFRSYRGYEFDDQIPRPQSETIMRHLQVGADTPRLGSLLSMKGKFRFSVGAVARNFIGIREASDADPSTIAVGMDSEEDAFALLQIIASPLFFEYWRTVGDGFHVTKDSIARFPITGELWTTCVSRIPAAKRIWDERDRFAKTKLNRGRLVRSYDFGSAFDLS